MNRSIERVFVLTYERRSSYSTYRSVLTYTEIASNYVNSETIPFRRLQGTRSGHWTLANDHFSSVFVSVQHRMERMMAPEKNRMQF
jgi:hypothetical protein